MIKFISSMKRRVYFSIACLLLLLCGKVPTLAGDLDVKLTTNDGSTKFIIQDSASVEVSSVNSDGHAYFKSLTQTGSSGGNVILKQNTLQSGATFYVSSGTVKTALYADIARVGGVINRNHTDVAVTNTNAETSVYSFTVPGNLLETNRAIRVVLYGTYLNNSGATKTIRLRLKYGATTVCDKTSVTNANSATTADVSAEFVLTNNNATNSQEGMERLLIDRAGSLISPVIDTGTAAEDSTADKTFDVTVTHSAASVSTTFTKLAAYAVLE